MLLPQLHPRFLLQPRNPSFATAMDSISDVARQVCGHSAAAIAMWRTIVLTIRDDLVVFCAGHDGMYHFGSSAHELDYSSILFIPCQIIGLSSRQLSTVESVVIASDKIWITALVVSRCEIHLQRDFATSRFERHVSDSTPFSSASCLFSSHRIHAIPCNKLSARSSSLPASSPTSVLFSF